MGSGRLKLEVNFAGLEQKSKPDSLEGQSLTLRVTDTSSRLRSPDAAFTIPRLDTASVMLPLLAHFPFASEPCAESSTDVGSSDLKVVSLFDTCTTFVREVWSICLLICLGRFMLLSLLSDRGEGAGEEPMFAISFGVAPLISIDGGND